VLKRKTQYHLYNYYLIAVLIGGLILLVAIIGAIVLTFEYRGANMFDISQRQLNKSTKIIKAFY